MANPTAEAFAARMKLVASQDFGGGYRPGLAAALANGTASPDDIVRIGSFVQALDTAKTALANQTAGIAVPTNPQDADLLNGIGEGAAIVQRANTTVSDTKDPKGTHQFLTNVGNTVSNFAANSGQVVGPKPTDFTGMDRNKSLAQKFWTGINWTLGEVGRTPGFVYRGLKTVANEGYVAAEGAIGRQDVAQQAMKSLGLDQQDQAAKALGYDTSNPLSDIAFLWNHGEADFNNLDPVVKEHGQSMVNTALGMFYTQYGYGSNQSGALASYQAKLDGDLRNGKINPKQYAQEIQNLNSPDFQATYKAVDSQHVSIGRDLAHSLGINEENHPELFNRVSGTGDLLWSLVADPTIVGGKVKNSIRIAKYGIDMLPDASRVSKLYGIADKVTGEVPQGGLTRTGQRVAGFLDNVNQIEDLSKAGRDTEAAALLAETQKHYQDLMPGYQFARGYRLAITPEERAAAEKAGTTMSFGGDATHEALAPAGASKAQSGDFLAVKGKPFKTVDEWADWLVRQGGVHQMFAGQAIKQARILPGAMGPWAEEKAALAAKRAYDKVYNGLSRNPMTALADSGTTIDHAVDGAKVIASDSGEAIKTAMTLRGRAILNGSFAGRTADGWLGFARSLKAQAENVGRRMTSLLPTNHTISFNSVQAGADIERFARTYLPAYEASLIRHMWEQAPSEAARRQIGKGMVNQVAEASGLTRSVVGRQLMDKWSADFDAMNARRYGIGDTDTIPDALNGGDRRVALHLSQLETHLTLPAFSEMRRVALKASILGFDKQIGNVTVRGASSFFRDAEGDPDAMGGLARILTSPSATIRYGLFHSGVVQHLFSLLKLGWLGTTSNMARQAMEEYVGLKVSHQGDALSLGKRVLRSNEDVYRQVTPAKTQIGLSLDNAVHRMVIAAHHLIPQVARKSVQTEDDVAEAITKGRLGLILGDRELTPAEDRAARLAAQKFTAPELHELLGGRQATRAEGGVEDAIAAHRDGVQTGRFGWKQPRGEFKGYVEDELNGDTGRKALAAMYTQRFWDEDEPARRALAYLMWHEAAKSKKFLGQLDGKTLKLMESLVPAMRDGSGKLLGASPESLEKYVAEGPGAAMLRVRGEILNHDAEGYPIAADDTAAQADAVKRYVAEHLIPDVAGIVYKRSGKGMHVPLVSQLLHGEIPAETDLARIKLEDLPAHVVRAEFAPIIGGGVGRLAEGITGPVTAAFDHIVTNPMSRLTRKPLFIGNYVKHFAGLRDFEEQLVMEHGWKPTEAERLVDNLATGQALHDTLRYIDNPRVASQFAAVAQNYWLFYRAQEDWVRRWGRIVKENPEMLRLIHAGIISGQNQGMIDRDQDGNLTFTYPGSGALIEAFMMAQQALGLGSSGVQIPTVHDLTSQVNYLNPSLMNPLGFSATPMLSLPWKMLAAAIPGNDMLKSQVDMAMQGQLGNGRQWWEQFMPTELNRFVTLTGLDGSSDNTGSTVGSAAATAILNATLTGQMGSGGDALQAQQKITNLKTQTLNALHARALFSFVAPAPASMPELDYKDKNGKLGDGSADFSWRIRGINNLNQEYKAMVQAFGVQKANLVWADLHPDKLIYEVGKTQASARGAQVDPTMAATQWVFDHKDLFDKNSPYSKVAAYFIPSAPGGFDQTGWNALMEIGVRQDKTLSQYYEDIAAKNGYTQWMKAQDQYNQQKAAAKAAGGDTQAIDQAWSDKKTQLYTDYPILHQYFADATSRANDRQQMVNELRQMVQDPTVKLPDLQGVAQMLVVMDEFNRQTAAIKGQRSTEATATRQALSNAYADDMKAIVKKFPGLSDMYTGVFQTLG